VESAIKEQRQTSEQRPTQTVVRRKEWAILLGNRTCHHTGVGDALVEDVPPNLSVNSAAKTCRIVEIKRRIIKIV
jgi:hypothetical protein